MAIYRDANDRRNFLSLLAFAVDRCEWTCHAFCLMTNHYHLVLDTTRQNLSDGMQILNGDYAQGFNAKYARWGHVFGDASGAGRSAKTSSNAPAFTCWRTPCAPVSAKRSRTGPGALAASSSVRARLRPARTRRTRH